MSAQFPERCPVCGGDPNDPCFDELVDAEEPDFEESRDESVPEFEEEE
jgi:hypothetical protein